MLLEAGILEENILEIIGCMDNEETPKKIVDKTIKKFGKIDVLVKKFYIYFFLNFIIKFQVNNAGASKHPDYEAHDLENLNYLFKANFQRFYFYNKKK